MGLFEKVTAEDVAAQHQLVIEMLLHVVFSIGGDNRSLAAESVEKMISARHELGLDTTILEATAGALRRQYAKE